MKKTQAKKASSSSPPRFFKTASAFHEWLDKNHGRESELLVGFYKKDSGKPSITYPEALDEALAHGWIDGVRRNVGPDSYSIRFTPRKPRSIWSNVNTKRVGELTAAGRMAEAGLAAFARRDEERSGTYSYEREHAKLGEAEVNAIDADAKASADWHARTPSYKRTVSHWIVSAKKPETRAKRLATLIECSRKGETIPGYLPKKKSS